MDAKGYRTETTYDENGNPTCVIDADAQAGLQPKNAYGCTQYRVYDELDRVTKIVDALIAYTPDEAGNVYEKTNRLGEATRSTFDAGNRLTRVDYLADGAAETCCNGVVGARTRRVLRTKREILKLSSPAGE